MGLNPSGVGSGQEWGRHCAADRTFASASGRRRGRLIVERVSGQTLRSSEAELSPGVQQFYAAEPAVVFQEKER